MNESPLIKTLNLIIALCVIFGEVVFCKLWLLVCCRKIRNLLTRFSYDAKDVQLHSS